MRIKHLILSLLGLGAVGCSAFKNLDTESFSLRARETGVILIDVRTPEEFAEGHIPGAVNIDWKESDFLDEVKASCPLSSPLAVYCRSGRRSAAAAKALSKAGYKVLNLKGGYLAWTEAGKEGVKSGNN